MPLNFGDTPDVVHADRRHKLETGTHPLGKHPSLSLDRQHEIASKGYKQAMHNVQRYTGRMPRNLMDVLRSYGNAMQILQDVIDRESQHRPQLEALAVKTVLSMPEYSSLAKEVSAGNIKIEAKLKRPDLSKTAFSDEPEDKEGDEPEDEERIGTPEFEVPEIKAEINDAVMKRRLINALTHGAAVTNNYAYHYYAGEELGRLDPTLANDYGKLMSMSEIGYWVQGDEVVRAAAGAEGEEAQFGSEEITQDDDGTPVIRATALTFPALVHEVVKGVMEYLAQDDEEDAETRKTVYAKADFIDEETWAMLLGPGLWQSFLDAVGAENRTVLPHLYDHILRMPTSEFNALVKGVVDGDPKAKQKLRALAVEIRGELGNQHESMPAKIARDLLD